VSTTDVAAIKAQQAANAAAAKAAAAAKKSAPSVPAGPVQTNVVPMQNANAQVAFSNGGILASPTH
jgi:hypothetical protein